MWFRKMKRKLGVSEIVAAMMLLLITVTIGTALYFYLYSRAIAYQQSVSQELVAEELRSKQQLTILLVKGDSGSNTITVIVAAGPAPVEINAIYVNNTLAVEYNPPRIINASTVEELPPIPLPNTLGRLSQGTVVNVKIVYAGGYAYAEASGKTF